MRALKQFIIFIAFYISPLIASAGFEVLGKMIYTHNAQKGDIYSTVIKVHNSSDLDQEIKIYQRDFSYNYEGAYFYNEPGSQKRSNSNWIDYSPKILLLKGKETQNIQFEVKVPRSDTIVGTYWSMLMIEGVTAPDHYIPGKNQMKINTTIRYAIQIATEIGKTGIGNLEFQKPGLVNEGEKEFFNFILVNTGERFISPEVSMELFDAITGKSVKVLKIPKQGMYPTTSTKWRFPLEGIPAGKTYKAVIVADGSGEDVFGLEYTIVL